ncbi:putative fatty acyl-CoA reductase CG5065 [Plodia interpunctella]|uniref:putative fatty acyl-CoA reductase CG5065 n=1 Tax=Plodia interpunctella TaxID=58824 RepID=UPI002368DA3E|nr:putative fatty acyl-CoA reductase CG5065 [Plodia interpunctella]XP_053625134.1 putative fatty acyl-CoA reductase CG5065 [Plodia interpunctella]
MTSQVNEWYRGRSILLTGASGLMGKVLIEKLLYSVPDVGYVYALVRSKRGKSPEARIEDMWKLPLFSRIREEKPHVMKKLIPVTGDIIYDNLGIEKHHLEKIYNEVSIVFHFAASLRLEAPLKEGLEMNTRGTLRVLELAKNIKKLDSFIHLSTAFCYPDFERLAEKVHDPPTDPHEVLRAAGWLSDRQLDLLSPSIYQKHPNSYTYSKRMAEALVREYYPSLPAAVIRPSIVTPSYKEPTPGWVDNLNGPIGLMVGAGKGVIRSMHCYGHYHAEVIPVDIAINAIIVAAYKIGSTTERPPEIPVFNLTTGDDRNTTWKQVLDIGKATVRKYPFEGPLWYPDGNIRHNKFIHSLCVFFYHIVPAYLIDFLLFLFGQKRFMVRIQNRISVGLEVLQYFTTREWWFDTNNFKTLAAMLNHVDTEIFPMDLSIIEDEPYIECCMLGGKMYCLKEKLENLPKARLQNNILFILDRMVTIFWYLFFLYLLASYFQPVREVLSYGGPLVRYLPLVGKAVFTD